MPVKQPSRAELEPIETASRDELAALQLKRLKQTLAHAYDQVPHYRRKFDAARVTPADLETLTNVGNACFPVMSPPQMRTSAS